MSNEKISLRVANLDCEHDSAAIERGLKDFDGIAELKIYPKSAKLDIEFDAVKTSAEALKEKLESLGFPALDGRAIPSTPKPWRNPKVITSVISGVLLLFGWLLGLAGLPAIVSLVIYIAAILIGGYYFGREAFEELIFEREIGIELLMSVAAIVATIMGQAAEGAMLVFLYSISEAAEGYAEEKTRSAIKALMDLAPKTALIKRNGSEVEIPVEDIAVGDIFIVKPGQSMPTDGEVLTGNSSVNEAPITGESMPVEKKPGKPIFAGSINGEGLLDVKATKAFAENTLARIIQMVEEAQERKGKSQRFIERFGKRYSPAVLLAGILIALLPPLLFAAGWSTWIIRATVFIVAAAPCALVISIPITLVATLGTAARKGVLIKGGVYAEELAKVQVVALDKTGTLTSGQPQVTDILVCRNGGKTVMSEDEIVALAAGIESGSEHPLARAVVAYARSRNIAPSAITSFTALTGAGVMAKVRDKIHYIGSPDLFENTLGVALNDVLTDIRHLQNEGKTVVLLSEEKEPLGIIAIRDTIRPEAPRAIAALHQLGVKKVVMLTGDNERTARAIADELGIDEVYAGLKPEDKSRIVRELSQETGHVAIGDGVNDAPALAEATVGVAMGAAGTDVALETADVVLMADDLEKLVYALKLAKRNQSVINQNLALSAVVIGALVMAQLPGCLPCQLLYWVTKLVSLS